MFDIPIIRQTIRNTCGAVCINMLEASCNIKNGETETYDKISDNHITGEKFCRTSLMRDYFLNRGYQACVVSVRKYKKVLKACTENNIYAIMLIRQDTHIPFGHFVVYRGVHGNKVYVNDPAMGNKMRIFCIKKLKKLARKSMLHGITQKNTILLVNLDLGVVLPQKSVTGYDDRKGYKISGNVFSCIAKYTKKVLLGENECWTKVK